MQTEYIGMSIVLVKKLPRQSTYSPKDSSGESFHLMMAPAPEEETEEEAALRIADHEQQMTEYRAEQERKEEERKAEYEPQQKQYEAEQARLEKLLKARVVTLKRIIDQAPASFDRAQMRVFLRLLIHLDFSSLGEVATYFSNGDENVQESEEEIVLAALDIIADANWLRSAPCSL